MMKRYAICLFALLPLPAIAHPGDHAGLDAVSALAHLFEPDHLLFAAITILASLLAYRTGRRNGAREAVRRREDGA